MRSRRTPIVAALGIAVLLLLLVLWSRGGSSFLGGGGELPDDGHANAAKLRGADGLPLLKDRPLPSGGGGEDAPPDAVVAGEGPAEQVAGVVLEDEAAGEAKRRRERVTDAGWRRFNAPESAAEGGGVGAAISTEEDVEVDSEFEGGFDGSSEVPPPTVLPGSIYEGLSNDDLLELLVAMRRLRDAGVFVKLTPEQYFDVQRLLPDLQGVRDADRISRQILGMGVGEWLDHDRGPQGRYVLR